MTYPLFCLPPELTFLILSEWSDLKTLTRLDTSITNQNSRLILLEHYFRAYSTWQLTTVTEESIEYMRFRGMRIHSIRIDSPESFNCCVSCLEDFEYLQVHYLYFLNCEDSDDIVKFINRCFNLSFLEVVNEASYCIEAIDWKLIKPEILCKLKYLKCVVDDEDLQDQWEDMWNFTFENCMSLSTLIIETRCNYPMSNATWKKLFDNNNRTLKVLHYTYQEGYDCDDDDRKVDLKESKEFLGMVVDNCKLTSFSWFFHHYTSLTDMLPLFDKFDHLDIQTNSHKFHFSCFKLSILDWTSGDMDESFEVAIYEEELIELFTLSNTRRSSVVVIEGCVFSNRILDHLPDGLVSFTISGWSQASTEGFRRLIAKCKNLSVLRMRRSRCVSLKLLRKLLTKEEKDRLRIVWNYGCLRVVDEESD